MRIYKAILKLIKILFVFGCIVTISMFYFIHSSYYQGVRSQESYRYAKYVVASISIYYFIHSTYPFSINELDLKMGDGEYVGKVTLNSQTGVIKIRLAGESLNEGVLIFSPKVINDTDISYTCRPLGVPPKYIPKECPKKGTE